LGKFCGGAAEKPLVEKCIFWNAKVKMPCAKKYTEAEKRRYPRLDKSRSFVFCNLQNKAVSKIEESFINNISVGGLCFDVVERANPGVNLKCEIYQPLNSQSKIIIPISISAKVIWIKELACGSKFAGNKYRIGVKFTKILPQDKERIAKNIDWCS